MVGDRYGRYAGTVFGVIFAIGLAGGAMFPWAVGQIAQARSVHAGLVLLLAGAGAVAGTVVVIKHRVAGRQVPARQS